MMSSRFSAVLCLFLLPLHLLCAPLPALAEEAATDSAAEPAKTQMLEVQKAEEKTEALRGSAENLTDKITKNLTDEERIHFYTAYSNYNLISTVGVVQNDVGNAIAACGKANPGMKEALDARLRAWSEAINPVMEEAKIKIDNMVAAQDYASPKDIRKLFKNLDDMRAQIDSQIDKIPVSTPEACEYLEEKMDETQEEMVDLLRSTLVSQATPSLEPAPETNDHKSEDQEKL